MGSGLTRSPLRIATSLIRQLKSPSGRSPSVRRRMWTRPIADNHTVRGPAESGAALRPGPFPAFSLLVDVFGVVWTVRLEGVMNPQPFFRGIITVKEDDPSRMRLTKDQAPPMIRSDAVKFNHVPGDKGLLRIFLRKPGFSFRTRRRSPLRPRRLGATSPSSPSHHRHQV